MSANELVADVQKTQAAGMWDRFQTLLVEDPSRRAVLDDRGYCLSRAELDAMSARIADEMQASGLEAGDVVILCMPNWTEWMAVYLAALRSGLIVGSMPVTSDPESLAYITGKVGAKAVVLPSRHRRRDFAEEADAVARHVGRRLTVMLVEGDHASRTWTTFDGPPVTAAALPDNVVHILFSSSTTGKSKAIAHSEESLAAYNRMVIDRYGVTDDQPIFMPSPLGHSTGFWHGARMSIMVGVPLVLQDAWNARTALELSGGNRCGITVAATPFLTDIVQESWDEAEPKLAGMRTFLCGGAPIPPSLISDAQAQMPGTKICNIWAMSEGGATSSLPDDTAEQVASNCGKAMPGTRLEVLSAGGSIAPRGTEGEIIMKTPSMFLGYIGQEDLYRDSFTSDGYFLTGDMGIVDHDDYLRITGRLKDLIIRGGVNIAPIEIESALSGHPDIARVAVVGEPDERLGERICAVIQPVDMAPTFDELTAWLKGREVPRRLWPESVRIISAMPETPAGKIRKNVLRDTVLRES